MKKNIKTVFVFVVVLVAGAYLFTRFYGTRLFVFEAKVMWHDDRLSTSWQELQFQQGGPRVRASMAYRAVQQQYGLGWGKEKVIEKLGVADEGAHVRYNRLSRWRDRALVYSLEAEHLNPWHLVFYYNKQGAVTRVRIERQLVGDTVFDAVIRALLTPFALVFAVLSRVFAFVGSSVYP